MANQREVEATYDDLGYFHALRTNAFKDYSCAYFNGDFSKSLDEAQETKHDWILKGVEAGAGSRVLDIGCGWGPFLEAVERRGGTAVGLTLSSNQWRYCRQQGLDARLLDYKNADPRKLGPFDAVVSIGAFEHFCSIPEYLENRQPCIYKEFFDFCNAVLKDRGRLFLQTMTWGKTVPDPAALSPTAPKDSAEAIMFRLTKFYPGSWLPESKDQILSAASEHFECVASCNGRLDYIETLNRWGELNKNLYKPSRILRSAAAAIRLIPKYLIDPDFRTQLSSVRCNDQQTCFLREIMSHERLFFKKKAAVVPQFRHVSVS
jgi:cyclopropane-fatty-acyl-phospholipid synthase